MIDNQVFLIFAIPATALLVGIACWEHRHHAIAPWAAVALLVAGVAWHAVVAFQGNDPAFLLVPLLGLVVGAAFGLPIFPMLMAGVGRWPLSRSGLLLLPAIGACLGPLATGLGIMTGLVICTAWNCRRWFTFVEDDYDKRPPLVACVVVGTIIAFSFMPPYARAQEDPVDDDIGTVTQSERLAAVVLAPDVDPGPPGADEHMTALAATEPLTLAEAAARLEALTRLAVEIEERPSRTGIAHPLAEPEPVRFDLEGSLVEIVDRLAALYGHRWEWRDTTIVFFRYWDAEFAASTSPVPDVRQARWVIDTDRDATLAEVLARWAGEAGWSLVWSAGADYSLGADAVFEGSFLGAVDALLADPATHATLTATAYQANHRLVIEEAR